MVKQHHFPKNTSGPPIQRADDNSKTTGQLIGFGENTKGRDWLIEWRVGGWGGGGGSCRHQIRPGTKGKGQGKRQMSYRAKG